MDSKVVKNAAPPNAGKGRVKGVPNKSTKTAKEAIALAAERLGGVDRLVDWCKEDPVNEKAFWSSVYPKLLPLQVAGDPDSPINVITKVVREIVQPKDSNG